jgi:hypothetical protein
LRIGDNKVTAVTPAEIRIKTPSGAVQTFRKPPEPAPGPDLAALYREQLRLRRCDNAAADEEGRLRALEYTIRLYRLRTGADLESAKRAVTDATIAGLSVKGVKR